MKKRLLLTLLAACLFSAGVSYAGLVAYWPLDEGSGQVAGDATGHGYNGTLGDLDSVEEADPAWVVDPVRGNVLEWAGDAGPHQWVNLTPHLDAFRNLNQGTIMAWVKLPVDGVDVVLSASDSGDPSSEIRLFYDPSYASIPGIRYDVRENNVDTYLQISSFPTDTGDNQWHHVAATIDDTGAVAIYVDGDLKTLAREVGFFSAVSDLDSMSLGRNIDNSAPEQWVFKGLMSDVVVASDPFPASVVAAIYSGSLDVLKVEKTVYAGSPRHDAIHVDPATSIAWEAPAGLTGPATYDLYLSNDANFPGGPTTSGLTAPGYDPGGLALATTYYWRVDVTDNGVLYPGFVSSFTTTGTVTEPSPANGANDTDVYVDMAWVGDSAIASYDVYLGTSPGTLTLQANVTDPAYTLPTVLDEFNTYYWRIDTKNASGGLIESGNIWSFTTGGLIARWAFDENGGTMAADSTGDADGEIHGATWVDGIIPDANETAPGSALHFDGTSYVDLKDVDLIEARPSMTLSAWIWLDKAQATNTRLVEHEDVFYFYISSNKLVYTNHGSTSATTSATVPVPGRWYHVVVAFDATSQDMYINGVHNASSAGSKQVSSIYPMQIGCRRSAGGTPGNFFTGTIDDVRVYSSKFGPESVADLYRRTYLPTSPNPADGATNVATSPSLAWTAGFGAAWHDVSLGTAVDANGVVPIDHATHLATAEWIPGVELDLNTVYYWQVKEVDSGEHVTPGTIWSFKTIPPKAYAPNPEHGAQGVDINGDLSWTAGGGGTYTHDVYLGTDPAALALVSPFQVSVSYDPGPLEWATTYYWRVDELDGVNVFAGDVWSFTTIVPTCQTPLAGDVNGDCTVNLEDFAVLASQWLLCNLSPVEACP
jgi:hypothetical protein